VRGAFHDGDGAFPIAGRVLPDSFWKYGRCNWLICYSVSAVGEAVTVVISLHVAGGLVLTVSGCNVFFVSVNDLKVISRQKDVFIF
jgi:hypothetical protein